MEKIAVISSESFNQLYKHSKAEKKDINHIIKRLAKLLSNTHCELGIIAGEEVSLEVAKLYDRNSGGEVHVFCPKNYEFKYESLIDKKTEAKSFSEVHQKLSEWCNKIIVLGVSASVFSTLGLLRLRKDDVEVLVLKELISKPLHTELKESINHVKEVKNIYEMEKEIKW
ncbi:MAG: hypothetical protein PHW96_02025 [Candidatus Nanoarchaeia archaeon]|nr:hypothetical protein [Candidatus Nanoarchaeia archaeon]